MFNISTSTFSWYNPLFYSLHWCRSTLVLTGTSIPLSSTTVFLTTTRLPPEDYTRQTIYTPVFKLFTLYSFCQVCPCNILNHYQTLSVGCIIWLITIQSSWSWECPSCEHKINMTIVFSNCSQVSWVVGWRVGEMCDTGCCMCKC